MADHSLRQRDFETALYDFWSGFGLPAWDENSVDPDAMKLSGGHYITYNVVNAAPYAPRPLGANLWYRDFAWTAIDQKAQQIFERIGLGGIKIPFNRGDIWIKRGAGTFSQRLADDDDTIRRIYITVMAEDLTSD